jgi:hypothetical protein
MNGIAIGLAAAAGAVAALIATLVVRKPNDHRVAYTIVFVVSFTILQALNKEFVLPRLTISSEMEKVERTLLALPAFQAIKQYDRTTYDALMSDLRAGLMHQISEDELLAEVKTRVEQLVQKRLPSASDEAVVTYMNVMIREMRELNRQDPALCYKFLFPQQYGVINALKHLPKELTDADSIALAQVIKTSAENPQSMPTEIDVSADLDAVVTTLEKRHGNGIAALQDLHSPTVSKSVGCELTAELYDGVLSLPQDRSSRLLRYLLSQG